MSHVAVVYECTPDSEQLHAQDGAAHVAFLQRLMDEEVLRLSGRADLDGRRGALLVLATDDAHSFAGRVALPCRNLGSHVA